MDRRRSIKFDITSWACIGGALTILMLPLEWFLGMLFAAAVHELGHILALTIFRVPIHGIKIGICGAQIATGPMSPGTEIICALAGPLGSIAVVLMTRWNPYAAFFAAAQCVSNIIPVYPMDGGRVIHSILEMVIPNRTESVMNWIEVCVEIAFILLGIYGAFIIKMGVLPLLAVFLWIMRDRTRKFPCKDASLRLQ